MAMKALTDIEEWWDLCIRYRYDLYAFSVELLGIEPTWQQKLLFDSICFDGSRTSVASGHGTGKTASAGIVALWHLLFFEKSIMMFTAPQIGQLKKQVWKEISINLDRLRKGPAAWLAEYVGFLSESIFIKGSKADWYVFAKTAPKHQSTNIAGNHGDNYMVWVDEACGVDDGVLDVVFGALTHMDNRAVMTSQPARAAGMFFDTHHRLSTEAGGEWTALCFDGEQSPLVSINSINEQLRKYGSRTDPQYQIRVKGIFPDRLNEFLISHRNAAECYVGTALFEQHRYGYVITVDVGGGKGRDDSVIAVAKVSGYGHWGDDARRAEVIDIPLCKNDDNIDELFAVISELMLKYSNAMLVVDDNGAGVGLGQKLKNNGIWYMPANWVGAPFSNEDRKLYANKRAQAYVCFGRAIESGRFKIKVPKYKTKFTDQITKIPYLFDDQSRYKIMKKEDMQKKGIKSPDLGDAFAFLFLEGVNYTEADDIGEVIKTVAENARDSRFDRLKQAAQGTAQAEQ